MGPRHRTAAALAFALLAGLFAEGPVDASPKDEARAPGAELRLERAIRIGSSDVYRYRQVIDGIEVLDASAVVSRRRGSDRVHADSTRGDLRRPGKPEVTKAQAIAAAERKVGVKDLREKTSATLVLLRREGGTLAYRVRIPAAEPLGDFEVVVDAGTKDVLSTENLIRRADGTAEVYDPNPVVEHGTHIGLGDIRNRDSALLTSLRTPVALPRIADGQTCLSGEWVEARAGRKRKRVCRAGLDFTDVLRSSKSFEALMAYFHIDRMQTYIQSLDLSAPVVERRQWVNASSFRQDNAFYSPFTKRISTGKGGVDDGEDGDILIHEYGHAIQDDQVPGFGRSFGAAAMGEGFGDYLAAAASDELSGGNASQNACIADWDAVSYSSDDPPCLRRADIPESFLELAGSCRRAIHCAGQVWSSALFELRGKLGDDGSGDSIMDRVVFTSHFLLQRNASFADGAQALIDAAELLGYPIAVQDAIEDEMIERDLL